jgi:CHAD domain-containing protein
VLKKLVWSCLQHFQDNLQGAMASDDAEYLHQMRVALRRLRVVLRVVEKIRADQQLSGLYGEVSDLCIALGRVREWDVFIAGISQPMCARMPGHSGLQALLVASERQRAACYATLRGATQARELQRLLLRFAIWMNGDYWLNESWQPRAENGQQTQDFATRRLRKLAKRFALSGQHLDSAEAAQLHALRIIAKKLRYSSEFFSALYDEEKAGAYLAALSRVQDVLGQINDVAVAYRLLDGLAADAALVHAQQAAVLEAVTLSRGWIAHDLSGRLKALQKSLQNFNKQDVFWKK